MLYNRGRLTVTIQRSPFDVIRKPEPLKENHSGWWSRRIDDTNRIFYKQDGDNIIIVAYKGHYNKKKCITIELSKV